MVAPAHGRILRASIKEVRAREIQPLDLLKEVVMAKKEPTEYRARLANDAGVIRGKIPSPLVRELGGRPGDYMVFRCDASGKVTATVTHSRGVGKAAGKTSK